MKSNLIKTFVAIVIVAIISVGGWYAYKSYFNKPEENQNSNNSSSQSTTMQDQTSPSPTTIDNEKLILRSGNFIEIDATHKGEGNVELIEENDKFYIDFKENFKVDDGPGLYVYLSEPQQFKNQAKKGLDVSKTVNIGKLTSLTGAQRYEISIDIYEKYNSAVIIWCEPFSVQFSRADLV